MGLNEQFKREEMKDGIQSIIYLFVQAILISQVVMMLVLYIGYVPTGSMSPTIPVGDKIMVWRLSSVLDQENKALKHGDLVVFEMEVGAGVYGEEAETTQMVKRLIALGGDTVEIDEGKVYVNGEKLEEDYVKYPSTFFMSELEVPEREMFVLGDNRANSYDSRLWDDPTISLDRVKGKVLLKIPSIKNRIIERYNSRGMV